MQNTQTITDYHINRITFTRLLIGPIKVARPKGASFGCTNRLQITDWPHQSGAPKAWAPPLGLWQNKAAATKSLYCVLRPSQIQPAGLCSAYSLAFTYYSEQQTIQGRYNRWRIAEQAAAS
jgi:hypothetical protein